MLICVLLPLALFHTSYSVIVFINACPLVYNIPDVVKNKCFFVEILVGILQQLKGNHRLPKTAALKYRYGYSQKQVAEFQN